MHLRLVRRHFCPCLQSAYRAWRAEQGPSIQWLYRTSHLSHDTSLTPRLLLRSPPAGWSWGFGLLASATSRSRPRIRPLRNSRSRP